MATDIFEVLDDLRTKLNEVSVKLTQIQDAMFGNQEYGREGLIARLADHEERLRRVERTRVGAWQLILAVVVLIVSAWIIHDSTVMQLSSAVVAVIVGSLVALLVVSLLAYNAFGRG